MQKLERLIFWSLYISLAGLRQMLLLSEPRSLAGLIILVMLLQESVGHQSWNLANTTTILIGLSAVPLTSLVLVSPIWFLSAIGVLVVVVVVP